jgi:hypothetical protein
MPSVKGRGAVERVIAGLPAQIEAKLLRGAARAGGKVLLDETKSRSPTEKVTEALTLRTKSEPGRIVVRVGVKGQWPRSLATWAEYGTDPHFISVDDSQREGKSVRRINETGAESLRIGNNFVGKTVHHPGAKAAPFLRPSLDHSAAEARVAMQSYVNARVTRGGIIGGDEPEGTDE